MGLSKHSQSYLQKLSLQWVTQEIYLQSIALEKRLSTKLPKRKRLGTLSHHKRQAHSLSPVLTFWAQSFQKRKRLSTPAIKRRAHSSSSRFIYKACPALCSIAVFPTSGLNDHRTAAFKRDLQSLISGFEQTTKPQHVNIFQILLEIRRVRTFGKVKFHLPKNGEP